MNIPIEMERPSFRNEDPMVTCSFLVKNQEAFQLDLDRIIAKKVWICLYAQKIALKNKQSQYYQACNRSNCFGTAAFLEGSMTLNDVNTMKKKNSSSTQELSIDLSLLVNGSGQLHRHEEAFVEGRSKKSISELHDPSTILLKAREWYIHAITFLGRCDDGEAIFFEKEGYNYPFRIFKEQELYSEPSVHLSFDSYDADGKQCFLSDKTKLLVKKIIQ